MGVMEVMGSAVRRKPAMNATGGRRPARRRNRLRHLVPIGVAALVTACGAPIPAATSIGSSGIHVGSLDVNGIQRTYRVYAPPPLSGSSQPEALLLVLHGGDEQAQVMEERTQFDGYAAADGFIVVYPNGHGSTWNAGSCCGSPDVPTSNEVAFIDALITRVATDYRVDASRVYVTGVSAGGAMAYTLACELSTRITAIASVAGTSELASCHPQRPVSVMEIHGTADKEVPYAGGATRGAGASPPIPALAAAWASRDACPAAASVRSSGPVQVTQWTGCDAGTTVVLETIDGGHHVWYAPGLGPADGALDASQVIWQFFSKLRRCSALACASPVP